ncbi:MAG: T9SS type A sorting domain-containing protein [Bacteroidales bacterium]|nr:T9SS type A sorting domain-containing protein [Bacteroidales bacterium]
MRKSLLLVSAASILALNAASLNLEPTQIDECLVMRTSPDGFMGLSDDELGTVIIVDYKTGEMHYLEPEIEEFPDGTLRFTKVYSRGMGNCLSNTGIALVSTTDGRTDGSYWDNGEIKTVSRPGGPTDLLMLNGVNADGTRICGSAGAGMSMTDDISCMAYPVVWTRGADGEFTEFTMLPVPEYDFTGRMPQMITAISISDDGKTIGGQVWDYFGMVAEPIVYTQDENGEWSYRMVEPIFYGHAWPENPGEPPTEPEPTEFMSEAGLKAYNDALDAYNNGTASLPQPDPQQFLSIEGYMAYVKALDQWDPAETPFPPSATEFMTEEELQAYNEAVEYYWEHYNDYPVAENYMTKEEYDKYAAAVNAYNEAFKQYFLKFEEFQIEYNNFIAELPQFDKNNVFVSGNGRYYATTSVLHNSEATPYRYDLEKTGEPDRYDEDIYLTYVNSEGIMMGGAPLFAFSRTAKILDAESNSFISVSDYIKGKSIELHTWVMDNTPSIGTPSGAQDLSIIWGWTNDDAYVTNILPVAEYGNGISRPAAGEAFGMKAEDDGTLNFTGMPATVMISDINGAIVFNAENPGLTVSPRLSAGLYIVKATGENGSVIIRKILVR